jgi:hypothetical protein
MQALLKQAWWALLIGGIASVIFECWRSCGPA